MHQIHTTDHLHKPFFLTLKNRIHYSAKLQIKLNILHQIMIMIDVLMNNLERRACYKVSRNK